jgi:hypothetical protein
MCTVCKLISIMNVWMLCYTGNVQTFTAPLSTTYILEVWGAQGGKPTTTKLPKGNGGGGAYAKGNYNINMDNSIYIAVGGKGANSTHEQVGSYYFVAGGWNGGGSNSAPQGTENANDRNVSSAGGGATSITTHDRGELYNFESHKTEIIIVAGAGGGGGGWRGQYGGCGGGLTGISSTWTINNNCYATNGTQTLGYKFGIGEAGTHRFTNQNAGGGGGGYYGGCEYKGERVKNSNNTSYIDDYPGGGGSSFISGHTGCNAINSSSTESKITHTGSPNHYSGKVFTNTVMKAGSESMPSPTGGTETGHSGNGYCKITWHPAL